MSTITKMCPMELKILLHYWSCANEYMNGDFSHPMVKQWVHHHCDVTNLLELTGEPLIWAASDIGSKPAYRLSDKGKVFVEHILDHDIPVPVTKWQMPTHADVR